MQALQYTRQVFIVSSSSEIAPQKHFSSWRKYYYYFLGIGRWSLDGGKSPYGQAGSLPPREQQ